MSELSELAEKVEEWRPVVGFEGFYEVSNLGRVKSLSRSVTRSPVGRRSYSRVEPERILNGVPSKNGHLTVTMKANGITRGAYIQWLVLEAFVEPRPDGMQCRHFPDRDPANNRLENLHWGTPLENSQDKRVHGTANGWKVPEAARRASAKSRTGLNRTAESVAKTAAALRGMKLSKEHCVRLSESHIGNQHATETRIKMSLAQKARWAVIKSNTETVT